MKSPLEQATLKADRSQALVVCLMAAMLAYSLLRGIRFPNLWSATHALFNYDFGFAKRALIGSLLQASGWNAVYEYQLFFVASFAVLAVNMTLLLVLASRLGSRSHRAEQMIALAFLSSFAIVFAAHIVGYFDHIALLLTLVAMLIGSFWLRFMFIAVFFSLAILMHETGAAIFGPVLMLALALDPSLRAKRSGKWATVALAAWFLLEVLFVSSASLDPESVASMRAQLQQRADFPLRVDAFEVLTRTLMDNISITMQSWRDVKFVRAVGWSMLVAAPNIAILLWASFARLARSGYSRRAALVICAVALSPLALNGVGWDGVRWGAFAITTSFLLFVTTAAIRRLGPEPTSRTRWLLPVCVALIVLNLTTSVALMDGFEVQSFPFSSHVVYLRDVFAGRESFPSLPRY